MTERDEDGTSRERDFGAVIDLIARSDFEQKPGGDTSQLFEYRDRLKEIAPDTNPRVVANRGRRTKFRPGALVIVINVDRMYDYITLMQAAKRGGHRVIVCSVHHSLAAVRQMRTADKKLSPYWFVNRLPETVREYLAYCRRTVILARESGSRHWVEPVVDILIAGATVMRCRRLVASALHEADGICSLSAHEELAIERDFSTSGLKFSRIPNGRPDEDLQERWLPWSARSETLLCVGRIEPRKRQLEVAAECERQRVRVKFVGALNLNSRRYCKEFQNAVSEGSFLDFVGPVGHDEVLDLMSSHRVLINPSWVEVQSLVDIEAVASGMVVCTTADGSSGEFMGDSVCVVSDQDVSKLVELASELAHRDRNPVECRYDWTWSDAVAELLRLGEDVS